MTTHLILAGVKAPLIFLQNFLTNRLIAVLSWWYGYTNLERSPKLLKGDWVHESKLNTQKLGHDETQRNPPYFCVLGCPLHCTCVITPGDSADNPEVEFVLKKCVGCGFCIELVAEAISIVKRKVQAYPNKCDRAAYCVVRVQALLEACAAKIVLKPKKFVKESWWKSISCSMRSQVVA